MTKPIQALFAILLVLCISSCEKEKTIPTGNPPEDQFSIFNQIENDTVYLFEAHVISTVIYPRLNNDTITTIYNVVDIGGQPDKHKIIQFPSLYPGDKDCQLAMTIFCYFKDEGAEQATDSAAFTNIEYFKTVDLNNRILNFKYTKDNDYTPELFREIPFPENLDDIINKDNNKK
ncbi:MAG: hypothetical protein ACEPOV_08855 [Hyphomicrobiales bacterium]